MGPTILFCVIVGAASLLAELAERDRKDITE
jgi:hypothetical protein